jgi:aminotransferase
MKAFRKTSEELANFIVREAHVMTVPGSAFGCYGEGYLRLSYAAADDELEEALSRIEKVVKKLKS